MSAVRCFAAIDLPPAVKRGISWFVHGMREHGTREALKFVPRENLHLTLRFFGNVSQEQLLNLRSGLAVACRDHGAIALNIKGVGAYPSVEQPTVAWAGVNVLQGDLVALQGKVEGSARTCGLAAEERPFTSHVTFGRKRGNRKLEMVQTLLRNEWGWDTEFGDFTADRVTLFSSELGSGPPVYKVIEEFPLT